MARPKNHAADSEIFDSFTETFALKPPVYEFNFCSIAASSGKTLQPIGRRKKHAARTSSESAVRGMSTSSRRSEPLSPAAGIIRTDRLNDLTDLPFADASAQTVLCRGALEHVFEPRRAVLEMERILKPGGMIFVSVPGSRSRSGASHFWHFTPHTLQRLLQSFTVTLVGWQGPEEQPHTVFAVGCKGPADTDFLRGLKLFPDDCRRRLAQSATRIGWIRKIKQAMVSWAFSSAERRRFADHYQVQFAVHMPVEGLSKQELLANCLGEIQLGTRLDLEQ